MTDPPYGKKKLVSVVDKKRAAVCALFLCRSVAKAIGIGIIESGFRWGTCSPNEIDWDLGGGGPGYLLTSDDAKVFLDEMINSVTSEITRVVQSDPDGASPCLARLGMQATGGLGAMLLSLVFLRTYMAFSGAGKRPY